MSREIPVCPDIACNIRNVQLQGVKKKVIFIDKIVSVPYRSSTPMIRILRCLFINITQLITCLDYDIFFHVGEADAY